MEFVNTTPDVDFPNELDAALYSMSELNLWRDCIDSVSPEQVILVWKLVEAVRTSKGFPDGLKM